MSNITMAIDDDLLEKARALARKKGTTLNAFVREQLSSAVATEERRDMARKSLLRLSETSTASFSPDYKWNREELYEERLFPRHKHSDLRSGGKSGK